jgi:hypothetical protein
VGLSFDEHKLLAPGVHEASIDEVKEHFGRFQSTDQRPKLFAKLVEYVEAVKKAACASSVIVDGSFVMACVDEPEDVDVILILPPGWDMQAELKPYQYNLLSKRSVKKTYGFDMFKVENGSVEEAEWIAFFEKVSPKWRQKFAWPDDIRKGIVRVHL